MTLDRLGRGNMSTLQSRTGFRTKHAVALLVSTCALALSLGVSREAHAQACVSAAAKKNLATCPGGKFKASVNKKPAVSFSSAPEALKKKQRTNELKAVTPDQLQQTAERDERETRLKPRLRKLLITEIANVERLYKKTRKRDKDRPQLIRRLAEGYVELESSARVLERRA